MPAPGVSCRVWAPPARWAGGTTPAWLRPVSPVEVLELVNYVGPGEPRRPGCGGRNGRRNQAPGATRVLGSPIEVQGTSPIECGLKGRGNPARWTSQDP
jgi:hypothetical protein